MIWLRTLLGLNFPDPVVGQVWRSKANGECIRVAGVRKMACGTVLVSAQHERKSPIGTWNPVAYPHSTGLNEWRRMLRAEHRELVGHSDGGAAWPFT